VSCFQARSCGGSCASQILARTSHCVAKTGLLVIGGQPTSWNWLRSWALIGDMSAYNCGVTWSFIEWSLLLTLSLGARWDLVARYYTCKVPCAVTCGSLVSATIFLRSLLHCEAESCECEVVGGGGMPAMIEQIPLQAGCPPRGGL